METPDPRFDEIGKTLSRGLGGAEDPQLYASPPMTDQCETDAVLASYQVGSREFIRGLSIRDGFVSVQGAALVGMAEEIAALRAELARLECEKAAAERERGEAKEQLQTVHSHVAEALSLLGVDISVNGYIPDSWTLREQCHIAKGKLTAATSRAEALEKERGARADAVSEIIDCLRCVLLQPGNADYEQDARAAIKEYLAILQPAKEVAGGK